MSAPAVVMLQPCVSSADFTGAQVPAVPGRLHEKQLAVQAVPQQTPWAQKPDRHSAAPAHDWPFPLRPQDPLMHVAGEAQSALVVQEFLHTAAPHWYGKQGVGLGVRQLPEPSHAETPVNVVEPGGHEDPCQVVPGA